jgi:hypothetical protein
MPMYASMSKNEHGKLGPAAAGYMLHRLFVQRHGWFIRALEPEGKAMAAWNSSTPTSVLDDRVPSHVQELFEQRLGTHGLGLRELSILASSLEHLVHLESMQRLTIAYAASDVSKEEAMSPEEALEVLDMYMSIYILGFLTDSLDSLTPAKCKEIFKHINELYPTFPETQQFAREVFTSVAASRDMVYFSDVEGVIAEIAERYGRFQDVECRQLKEDLLKAEDKSVGGAGRVRLADFYKMALHDGKWQFSESVDYLRQLGALDESEPQNLRVIVPNYITSPSNCVASSQYYSVCCIDECEGLLRHLEDAVAAPDATPEVIVAHVEQISSATVAAGRKIPEWLYDRLKEIASHHGGVVPLHGRLFAQWLHFAYPRECPFPHVAGAVNPQRPEDILQSSNASRMVLTADETEMAKIVAEAPALKERLDNITTNAMEESAMWSMHEELVVHRDPLSNQQQLSLSGLLMKSVRGIAMVAAVWASALALFRSFASSSKASSESAASKFYV